jgi:hypothetical protein
MIGIQFSVVNSEFISQRLDRLWGPTNLVSNVYRELLYPGIERKFPSTFLSAEKLNIFMILARLQRGVGLVISCFGPFDTAHNYISQFTVTYTLVSTVTFSLAVAWYRLPTADVPLPSPCLSYQFPAATAHND